ncbi:MAG: hypothetical protein JJU00_10845 [Opitutales bacterium]|nr:hypothetical protein [Opitutales bacterium]
MRSICLLRALALLLFTAPVLAAVDYEAGFDARAGHLLDFIADGWGSGQPFPNFSNAHMHYWAGAAAVIAAKPEGVNHPQVNDGDGASSRPPRYWGVLKYDGEAASGDNNNPANRGSGSNTSFSWNSNVFHFIFPGLAYLMGMHPGIPAWDDPHHRDNALTYRENYLRYVLTRTDNYNAFTGEGTENHINMSRPAGWVLASEAVRLGIGGFAGQPYTAAERAEQMRQWILDWSRRIYEVGIGEWDSGTYHMVSLQGWFAAYDYAGTDHGADPEMRAAARAVIDYYAAVLALKHVNYHIGGAESRSGRNFSRMDNGTAYLAYVWFADTDAPPPGAWRGNQAGEAVYAAVSGYRPPREIVRLARKGVETPETYRAHKPAYLLQDGRQTVEVVHLGRGYTLGSANMNIGSFHASTWQIQPWKLMVEAAGWDQFPAAVVTGNGGFYGLNRNHTRDPWMQLVQHENVLIQFHLVPSDASSIISEVQSKYNEWKASWYEDFTARWSQPDWGGFHGDTHMGRSIPLNFQANTGNVTNARTAYINYPQGAELALAGGVRFARMGDVYIAVRSIRAAQPGINTSNRALTDTAPAGQLFGLVMEVGTAAEHGTFADFRAAVTADTALDLSDRDAHNRITYTTLTGVEITATYETNGSWIEPDYDWNYGVTTPGGVALMHAHDWRQPDWPQGEGHGRQPGWSVDGDPVDTNAWAVFEGPRLRLRDSRLDIFADGEPVYSVDYTGELPETVMPLDPPGITAADGSVTFSMPTRPGLLYHIQRSADLTEWTSVGETVAGDGGPLSTLVEPDAGDAPVFFRVLVRP